MGVHHTGKTWAYHKNCNKDGKKSVGYYTIIYHYHLSVTWTFLEWTWKWVVYAPKCAVVQREQSNFAKTERTHIDSSGRINQFRLQVCLMTIVKCHFTFWCFNRRLFPFIKWRMRCFWCWNYAGRMCAVSLLFKVNCLTIRWNIKPGCVHAPLKGNTFLQLNDMSLLLLPCKHVYA